MEKQHRKVSTQWFGDTSFHDWCGDCVELWPCEAVQESQEEK